MQLCEASAKRVVERADAPVDGDLEQVAHDALFFLYGTTYQFFMDNPHISTQVEFCGQTTPNESQRMAALAVTLAAKDVREDLQNKIAVKLRLPEASLERVNELCRKAVSAVKAWKKDEQDLAGLAVCFPSASTPALSAFRDALKMMDQTKAEKSTIDISASRIGIVGDQDDGHSSFETTTFRTTAFNAAAFKRLPAGKSGQKNYEAPDEVPMQYTLSQKKASKNGAPKKPVFRVDLSNGAVESQARLFSHSSVSETNLTAPSCLQTITLVVIWEKPSVDFATRSKVEARTEITVGDVGELVAFAVVMRDHAEQEVIDGGWDDKHEEWKWETEYPDVRTAVRYRRLG